MKFGLAQKRKFGTSLGAYSVVTERENIDSQITLTDYEAELVVSHFGKDHINVGNVNSDPNLSSKTLRLYPSGISISLNIVFPKPEKSELRLYISSRAGFKPSGGEVWFMFSRDGELWIGSMAEQNWRSESSELKMDEGDSLYQESIDEPDVVRIAKLRERDVYARDRNIALKRMEISGFSCEFDSTHELFVSRFSHKPYLEAHHLVPMGVQGDFKLSLDVVHNVFCLCPNCHRAVHHADEETARNILVALAGKSSILEDLSLTNIDLFTLYAIEDIV